MLIKKPTDIASSEITTEAQYLDRRKFLAAAGIATVGIMGTGRLLSAVAPARRQDDKPNTYEEITNYNNYYEIGTEKEAPAANAKNFRTKPWTVKVDGLVKKPAEYHFEDLVKPYK